MSGETNARILESLMIQPPPSNEPPGIPGVKAGQPALEEGIYSGADLPVPDIPASLELSGRLKSLEERIAYWLREHERPDLYTIPFVAATPPGWYIIVPPVGGGAIYVTGVWIKSSVTNVPGAFGQGQSAGDAEYFNGQVATNTGAPVSDLILFESPLNISVTFPDWLFRCDPGKGFAFHFTGPATFDGYVQYFVRPISEEKYR